MGLSEERKRQILEDEEAAFRAEMEAEQRYREQVRRELAARHEQETTPLHQTRAERVNDGVPDTSASSVVSPADSPHPVSPASTSPRRRMPVTRIFAGLLALIGIACMAVAVIRGFQLPVFGGPREITFTSDPSSTLEPMEEDSTLVPATAAASRAVKPGASATATPTSRPAAAGQRVFLPGTSVSIEAPPGWTVANGDGDVILEITWRGSGTSTPREGESAYVLLQQMPLQRGETTEDFAERLLDEFGKSTTPEQQITYENDEEIADFHGVPALTVDVVARGEYPYRMRNIYWTAGGAGYLLTCYATAGSYAERQPAFTRMRESVRLQREGR